MNMRPSVRFLSDELIKKILEEARDILCKLGVSIHNKGVLDMLSGFGAKVDTSKSHVFFTEDIIDKALKSTPASFKLYDVHGNETHDFSG